MLTVVFSYAQEEMTMEEYNTQLNDWESRKAAADSSIADVEEEIESLKGEIAAVDEEIEKEWDEIYALLGTDKAGVEEFRSLLNGVGSDLDGLDALSPEELFKRRKEIDQLEANLNELKQNNIALLSEMQSEIDTLEGKIVALRAKMPKAIYDEYTVIRGDYLWKIAGKDDIYDDPYQWIRIYTYNKDQIKNPDLIYADQIFKIQREVGPNEYLVVKGDYLAKIAGSADVYSDPTKWTKIFEANKDIINDQNVIYPHQVLIVPE